MNIRKIILKTLLKEYGLSGGITPTVSNLMGASSDKPYIPFNQMTSYYQQTELEREFIDNKRHDDVFSFSEPHVSKGKYVYSFQTFDGDTTENANAYIDISFELDQNSAPYRVWNWSIKTALGEDAIEANKNQLTKFMTTLVDILNAFFEKEKPDHVNLKLEFNTPTAKNLYNVFYHFLKANLSADFKIDLKNNVIKISRRGIRDSFSQTQKLTDPHSNEKTKVSPDTNGY